MDIVILIVLAVGALVVMGMVLRIVVQAVKQSRRGEVPTEEQRRQIMVLGGIGVVLALISLLVPSIF